MTSSKGKILLVNPWIVDFAAYDFWIKPIGLLLIGSVLHENGYEVTLLDCMDRNHRLLQDTSRKSAEGKIEGTGRFIKEIIQKPDLFNEVPRRYGRYGLPLSMVKKELKNLPRPDAVFMTSGMTYWYPGVVRMTGLVKETFPKIPVVLGGIYATLFPDHARKVSGAHYVIAGEGEIPALQMADNLTGSQSDVHRYGESEKFPPPLYELYPVLKSAVLLTSRGCPYNCPFCASRQLSTGYRRENPEHIAAFIERLYTQRDVRHFAFYDDALLTKKEDHVIPLLNKIVEKNLSVHFHTPNGIQPREIDEPTAHMLRESGFETLWLSFESSSRNRQKRMDFKVTNEDLVRAVKYLFDAGFQSNQLGSYLLSGLPGQELGEVVESIAFVYGLGIKISLASFSPIPGTQCWQDALDEGLLMPGTDPLMTNNTFFPILSKTIPYKRFLELGTLVAEANRILNRGENPLNNSDIVHRMKQLEG